MNFPIYSKKISRISVSSFFFVYGFTFASWASRIPNIQQKLNLSEGQLGLILLALPVGSLISLPLSGWLVAKYGSKKIILIASVFYTVSLILIGLAPGIFYILIALFLFGLVGNMGNISVNTQAVGVELLYGKPIMGSFHGTWSLAGFMGAAMGTLMIAYKVIPIYHFIIACSICILVIVFAFKFLLNKDNNNTKGTVRLFSLPDRALIVLGCIAFCSMICEGTMFDWSGVYFKKVVHAPTPLIGTGYTAFMSTMALSRFLSDWVTKRVGFKRTIQGSGCLIMAGLLTSVIFPYFYSSLMGFLLVGAGVSSIIPLVYSAAGRSKKLSAGMALAAVSSIGFLGFLVGPPLIGMLAGISGLRLSFTIIALMGLTVTILVSFTKEKY